MKKYTILAAVMTITMMNSFAQNIFKATAGSVITVQNAATLYITGSISLDDNSSLTNAGVVIINGTAVPAADFTDNTINPYNYGTGKFIFTGSIAQTINSRNLFERIEVDDAGLNLSSTINANTWYLKKGKITTNAFMAIAASAAALSVQADVTNTNFVNSWINGTLRRFITPAAVNNYPFPVGDVSKVNIMEMDNLSANPLTGVNYVTASFGPKPGNDIGLNVSENGTPYTAVNNGGVWYLVPDANPSAGKYDIKLYFNGFSGLADNSFGILRRPDASALAVDWVVTAGSALPPAGSLGRTVAGGYARRNNISTFSQLGIGTTLAPLPLQLLNFYAVKKDKSVLLQWTTSNEINSSHFELYKSGQPITLQYLDKVTAAGYSGINTTYSYIDSKPLKGLNFYQLKMVDKDNSYTLSNIIKINFEDPGSLQVYPNPVTNKTVYIDNIGGTIKAIVLIAADGKQYACNFTPETATHIKVGFSQLLAKGDYILRVITNEGLKNITIMIQ